MLEAIRRSAAAVLLVMALLGCEESRVDLTSFSESVGIETRQFALALRNTGASAEVAESIPPGSSLLSAPTTRLRVNGADVFVFEFASAAETDAAVARLPAILAVTTFPAGPHFYRGNRIIVLYVGTDSAIMSLLERLLGRPIA